MKKRLLLIAALFTATILAACGGGGGDDTLNAASSNLSSNVTASNAAAIQGLPFTFASGVPDFGTSQTTTVTVTGTSGTDTFAIASGGNTASGQLNYGSCIFKFTASTFPAASPLAVGNTITIADCHFNVNTKGTSATGLEFQRVANLVLNAAASAGVTVTVSVNGDGTVVVNGVGAGSVTLTPLTGSAI